MEKFHWKMFSLNTFTDAMCSINCWVTQTRNKWYVSYCWVFFYIRRISEIYIFAKYFVSNSIKYFKPCAVRHTPGFIVIHPISLIVTNEKFMYLIFLNFRLCIKSRLIIEQHWIRYMIKAKFSFEQIFFFSSVFLQASLHPTTVQYNGTMLRRRHHQTRAQ